MSAPRHHYHLTSIIYHLIISPYRILVISLSPFHRAEKPGNCATTTAVALPRLRSNAATCSAAMWPGAATSDQERGEGRPPDREEDDVAEERERQQELTPEELEQQEGAELPDREAMSLINANVAAPINAAVALNALSDGSVAVANAEQTAPITQTNG